MKVKTNIHYKSRYISNAMCKTTFYTLGPKIAKPLLKTITDGIKYRGQRDTAKRLKSILVAINLMLDRQYDKAIMLLHENRINGKSKQMWTFRVIHNSLQQCKSDIKASRLYTVLKLYTGLNYFNDLSLEDKLALTSTITEPNKNQAILNSIIDKLLNSRSLYSTQTSFDGAFSKSLVESYGVSKFWQRQYDDSNIVNILSINHTKSRFRNCMLTDIESGRTRKSINKKVIADLINYSQPSFIKFENGKEVNGIQLNKLLHTIAPLSPPQHGDAEVVVIPKPGSDGRVIAKLPLVVQLLMQKRHNSLESFRESIGFFNGKDQASMSGGAHSKKTRCCTDLSAATDRIPRILFTKYLGRMRNNMKEIVLRDYYTHNMDIPMEGRYNMIIDNIDSFITDYISSLNSICNMRGKSLDGNVIRYHIGQPMGMLGSFPILDICNYLLASNADPTDSSFRIVGDDIVFDSKEVMHGYIETCNSLDIPISMQKTYENGFAQAVGREIYDNGVAYPLKFSKHKNIHDKNFLMWYASLYPKLINVTEYQRKSLLQEWYNNTYSSDQIDYHSKYQGDGRQFINVFNTSVNLILKSLEQDGRKTNYRKRNVNSVSDMLLNSDRMIRKLLTKNFKSDSISLDNSQDFINNATPNGETLLSVPHTISDRLIKETKVSCSSPSKSKVSKSAKEVDLDI